MWNSPDTTQCKIVPFQVKPRSAEFLIIALNLHRKSLLHRATHSIITHLREAFFGSTDSLVLNTFEFEGFRGQGQGHSGYYRKHCHGSSTFISKLILILYHTNV